MALPIPTFAIKMGKRIYRSRKGVCHDKPDNMDAPSQKKTSTIHTAQPWKISILGEYNALANKNPAMLSTLSRVDALWPTTFTNTALQYHLEKILF